MRLSKVFSLILFLFFANFLKAQEGITEVKLAECNEFYLYGLPFETSVEIRPKNNQVKAIIEKYTNFLPAPSELSYLRQIMLKYEKFEDRPKRSGEFVYSNFSKPDRSFKISAFAFKDQISVFLFYVFFDLGDKMAKNNDEVVPIKDAVIKLTAQKGNMTGSSITGTDVIIGNSCKFFHHNFLFYRFYSESKRRDVVERGRKIDKPVTVDDPDFIIWVKKFYFQGY